MISNIQWEHCAYEQEYATREGKTYLAGGPGGRGAPRVPHEHARAQPRMRSPTVCERTGCMDDTMDNQRLSCEITVELVAKVQMKKHVFQESQVQQKRLGIRPCLVFVLRFFSFCHYSSHKY